LRYVSGVRRDSVNLELLRALDAVAGGVAVPARELAEALGTPVQSVSAKLRPLRSAGLVLKSWDGEDQPGRAYTISEVGREYLARVDSAPKRLVGAHSPRRSR
jgi:DNA-binding transcriptional ArsR family regulator